MRNEIFSEDMMKCPLFCISILHTVQPSKRSKLYDDSTALTLADVL